MYEELITEALKARENSYAPYSDFTVGAAVLTADERIFTGCNVENASYGATNCAERTAIFKAVSEGAKKIKAIAIAGGRREDKVPLDYIYPCGICRQVISEFAEKGTLIFVAKSKEDYKIYKVEELLPCAFSSEDL